MYCPQCGQQQASEEMRFCSRCGLPLGLVARVVAGGGGLEGVEPEAEGGLSARQRGMRMGVLVMAAAFALGLITLVLTGFKDDFFVLLFIAALGFTFGLVRMLYGALLEEHAPRRLGKAPARPALHEARTPPAAVQIPRGRVETAEMAAPASITETTTRLLEEEENKLPQEPRRGGM